MHRSFLGTYAASTFDALDKQVRASFLSDQGPGVLPSSRRHGSLKACAVPLGSYADVGSLMAWAYKDVAERELADLYVLVGGHDGLGILTNLFVDWATPFGVVRVDKELGKRFIHDAHVRNEYETFIQDTTIERQLPFLQFACRDAFDKLLILPILVGKSSPSDWELLGQVLGDLAEQRNVCVLGGFDLDSSVVSYLTSLDAQEAVQAAQRRQLSHPYALGAFAEIVKHLYCRRGTILASHNNNFSLVFA